MATTNAAVASVFHTLIVQPTTLCNLDCVYCYLPDRKRQALMEPSVAEALAASITEQDSTSPVEVVWHGGEPTATPLGHMRSLLAPFEAARRDGRVVHGVQTNASLITPQWCELFTAYGIRVGVSIDGPSVLNAARVDWYGKPVFDRIMRGIRLLRAAAIPFTAICVVTPQTIGDPDVLLLFFEELGCTSVGFNLEEQEGVSIGRLPLTVTQAEAFWLRLWQLRESGSPLRIRDLDRFLDWLDGARTGGGRPPQPMDPIPTVAISGDVVILSPELLGIRDPHHSDFIIGNVLDESLPSMLARSDTVGYVQEFTAGLNACAATCEFFDFCRGAQAGNRYFEHGTFAVTETTYCRNTRQALVRAAATHTG